MTVGKLDYLSGKILLGLMITYTLSLPFKNSIYQISTLLLYGVVVWQIYQQQFDWSHTRKFILIFAAIFVSMSISNALGDSYGYGIDAQVRFFYHFVPMFFIVYYLLSKQEISSKVLFFAILAASLLTSLLGVVEFVKAGYDLSNRLHGGTYSPNAFSLWLMIGIIFLSHLFLRVRSNIASIPLFVLVIALIGLLILTQSRAAWLGTVIGTMIYIILNWKFIKKTRLNIAIFSVGIVLLYLWFNNTIFHARIETILHGDTSNRTSRLWPWAFEMIKQNLLFGHGMNAMRLLRPFSTFDEVMPHNIYIELLLFLGVFGFIIFMSFFVTIWMNIKNTMVTNLEYGSILASLLGAFMVDGFFDQSITMSLYFVSLIMIIAAVSLFTSKNQTERHSK